MQFYVYDFTEFTNLAIRENGSYPMLPDLHTYWGDTEHKQPYIIKVDQEIAGFILVKQIESGARCYNYLAHFFILRKFRGSGIGLQAAKLVIHAHDGEWEMYQLENNIQAQKFWDKVLNELTTDKILVKHENGRRYQTFCVS